MRVDGTKLNATYCRWPYYRFVDSKKLFKINKNVLKFNFLTHFRGSNARMQWPGGTLQVIVALESMSQRVGECTNTGEDERL